MSTKVNGKRVVNVNKAVGYEYKFKVFRQKDDVFLDGYDYYNNALERAEYLGLWGTACRIEDRAGAILWEESRGPKKKEIKAKKKKVALPLKLYKSKQEQKAFNNALPKEMIHHPDHYGGDTTYEVIKVLQSWLPRDEFIGFLKGNVMKYIARSDRQGNVLEDHKKAVWYEQYLIDFLAGKKELPK